MGKNFEVERAIDGSYVRIRVLRDLTRKTALEMLGAGVTELGANGARGFLVDVRGVRSGIGTLDAYDLVHHDLRALGFPRGVPCGWLAAPGDATHEFLETVARNAGYLWTIFLDEARAVAPFR